MSIPNSSCKRRKKSKLRGDGISSDPLSLIFQGSHKVGSELRKVTFNFLSAMETMPGLGSLHIPGLGNLQGIPGKTYNLLSNGEDKGLSARNYSRFCDEPILALHSIHYCVTGHQGLRNLSKGSGAPASAGSMHYVTKQAGDLIKRLTHARDKGSEEEIVEAIEELRASSYAYTAGSEAIPELCEKLKKITPEAVRRNIERKENLEALLGDLIEMVESHVVRVRSLVNHDFLVLEVHDELDPDDGKVDTHFIRAEKLCEPAGIHIRKEAYFESLLKQRGAVLFQVQCGTGKHFTRLTSLEAILLDFDLDYRLADSCCWDYAVRICKALLQACADLPSTSIQEKQRLYDEIKRVRAQCGFYSVFGFMDKVLGGKR